VTLGDGSTFGLQSSVHGPNDSTTINYDRVAVDAGAAATVRFSHVRRTTTIGDLAIPAGSTVTATGTVNSGGEVTTLALATPQANLHGTLELTFGRLSLPNAGTLTDGTLMWSGGALALTTNSLTGTTKFGYNNGNQNALTTLQDYTGGTIFKSGVVTFTNDNQLGGATAPLIFDGGTLRVNTSGAYATSRGVTLESPGGTLDTNGKATTFSGTVEGGGGLTKAGAGDLTLGVANTFSGDTRVSGGTLTLGDSLALQNSTLDYNNYGGTVSFGSLGDAILGGLEGGQNLALPTGFTLTVGNNDQDTLCSGQISGNDATLTKTGSGMLTLAGANTYSGLTQVDDGTLRVTGTVAGSPIVAISGGAILDGTGTLSGMLGGDGLVSPGTSPGILTALAVEPSDGLAFAFEFTAPGSPDYGNAAASVNDVLRLTGAPPFAGALGGDNEVSVYFDVESLLGGDTFRGAWYADQADPLAFIAGAGYQFYVADPAGGTVFNGVNYMTLAEKYPTGVFGVTTLAEEADFGGGLVNGWVTQFTFGEVVIPEPGTVALLAVAGLLAVRRRRRR